MNSEGSNLSYEKMHCGISLTSVAKDGSIIQPFHESVSGYGGYEIVRGREELAEKVVKIAVDMLSAEPLEGGTYDVILDPRLSGVFIHEAFGHLSEADFIHENPRMKEQMTLGREFGPVNFNVIDDGSIPGLAGYIPFDDETRCHQCVDYLNKLFGLDDSFRSGIKKSVTQFKATKSMWDLAKAKKNGENLEEKAKETVDAFGATIIGDRTQFKDAADQALANYDLD